MAEAKVWLDAFAFLVFKFYLIVEKFAFKLNLEMETPCTRSLSSRLPPGWRSIQAPFPQHQRLHSFTETCFAPMLSDAAAPLSHGEPGLFSSLEH